MNENQLYQGFIVIPLLYKSEADLGRLFPNFLIIESQSGGSIELRPNDEGVLVPTSCVWVSYKICKREILPTNQYFPERFNEICIVGPNESLALPVDFLHLIFTPERISQNVEKVNAMLNLLRYEGSLNLLTGNLIVDNNELPKVIAEKNKI